MRFAATLVAPLALSLQVAAHGFIGHITIDGKEYKGNGDGGDPSTTAIRPTKPYDVGPVLDVTDKQMSCGLSPVSNAALVADANAGSALEVLWVGQGNTNWIHEVGPVMHYMAECTGVDDCTTFDSANAKWFKIDEQGFKSDGTTWVMQDLYNGKPVKLNIPENLKSGNYLLRSEVIALHRANVEGGAEFYPNCVQLKVGGSGTETPSSTVKFPGAYSATDPGILVPDIFNPGFKYTFPGGAVANLGGSGSSSSGSSSDDDDSSSTSKSAATATAKASGATSTKKAASTSKAAASTADAASTAAVAEPTTTKAASTSSTKVGAASSSAAASASTGRCKAGNRKRRAEKKRQADEALARRAKAARAHHNA
ncbi:unnamed protein product, partial [Peniophora sp. CBMAI 1063]